MTLIERFRQLERSSENGRMQKMERKQNGKKETNPDFHQKIPTQKGGFGGGKNYDN